MKILKPVAENVWEANAPVKMPGLKMDHRMTVVRLGSGELIVHSPIEFSADLHRELLEVGRPKWFVAPSRLHDLYWPNWFRAFSQCSFLAAPGVKEDHPELPFTGELGKGEGSDGELIAIPIRGMPKVNEVALYHGPSRSLLLADLIFNLDAAAQNFIGRLFLKANGISRKAGISRIFRSCIQDRAAFQKSMDELQMHSLRRIVIGHGQNLSRNEALERVLSEAGFHSRASSV